MIEQLILKKLLNGKSLLTSLAFPFIINIITYFFAIPILSVMHIGILGIIALSAYFIILSLIMIWLDFKLINIVKDASVFYNIKPNRGALRLFIIGVIISLVFGILGLIITPYLMILSVIILLTSAFIHSYFIVSFYGNVAQKYDNPNLKEFAMTATQFFYYGRINWSKFEDGVNEIIENLKPPNIMTQFKALPVGGYIKGKDLTLYIYVNSSAKISSITVLDNYGLRHETTNIDPITLIPGVQTIKCTVTEELNVTPESTITARILFDNFSSINSKVLVLPEENKSSFSSF